MGVAFLVKNFAPEAKGHGVPDSLRASLIQVKRAGDITDRRFMILRASLTLAEIMQHGSLKDPSIMYFLVENSDGIIGMVTRESVLAKLKQVREMETLGDIARTDYLTVTEKTSILRLFSRIFSHEISFVLVLAEGTAPSAWNVLGLITKERLAEFVSEAAEQFS